MEMQKLMNNNIKVYKYNKNLKDYLLKFIGNIKILISIYIYHKNLINFLILFLLLFTIIFTYFEKNNFINYKNYIKDCKNLKRYYINKNITIKNPFISICLPVYNMEKYIERAFLSIINQSFQNFEIIIVNDNSNDNTENIIRNLQINESRLKIIKNNKNLGVYTSRIEAIQYAKGEYILLMDPDDMIINSKLFEILYNFNLNYSLDIVEFSVFHQIDKKKTIYYPKKHELNHYHNFEKNIIYQPELSNIIFFKPNTKSYSYVICRTIWNKLIKKRILTKAIKYIEIDFHDKYLITADDTPLNIISFNFANNYSNINLPGYLYNVRKNSMSNGSNGIKHDIIVSVNYLLYFKLFYRYIKDYKKDLNFLYYDIKVSLKYLLKIKKLNVLEYIPIIKKFFKCIISEKNISKEFKIYVNELLLYFE